MSFLLFFVQFFILVSCELKNIKGHKKIHPFLKNFYYLLNLKTLIKIYTNFENRF